MAPKVPLDWEMLGTVFEGQNNILKDIKQEADTPERIVLFNNIATFLYNKYHLAQEEPASKRRRVDVATVSQPNGHASAPLASNGASASAASSLNSGSGPSDAASEDVLVEIKDISLSAPQRKKYDLCFTKNFLYARASGTSAPAQGILYPWKDIEHAFYLPVPEKSQVQHNYVLFPRNSYLPTGKPNENTPVSLEPLVFTIPATAPKPGSVLGSNASSAVPYSDSYATLFNWALATSLRSAGNSAQIVSSDPKVFHSVARQPYRPTEKAVHVKAFRGSKDGYLFFLPTGILWGFKKPLLFLPLDKIIALSYTSVLQRTFNIVIEYEGYGTGAAEEIEFGMLDQEDYGEIDTNYVKRHGLADRSMAEQRKAKKELAENDKKVKGEEGEEDGAGGQLAGDEDERMKGMTELEKAQYLEELRLQEEEDEDEEDYDPGSEGESEGSGSSSEEDDDDEDDEDEDEDGEGGDDDDGDAEMAG
ncbi:hypothetical protein V8F20_006824 [Naviculisporaceae sp. PSN 640]